MPTKPPFDPEKHYVAKPPSPGALVDDEVLARLLQEEILEQERQAGPRSSGYQDTFKPNYSNDYGNQSAGDRYGIESVEYKDSQLGGRKNEEMELLMMMQRKEMDAIHQAHIRQQQQQQQQQASQHRSATQSEDMEFARAIQEVEISNQGGNGFQDQLDYAIRVQEQAFAKVDRNRGSQDHSQYSIPSNSHDSDLELAIKMQELEQMGMGSLNSIRNLMGPSSQAPVRFFLEDEDTQLARMLSESGEGVPFMNSSSKGKVHTIPLHQSGRIPQSTSVPGPPAAIPVSASPRTKSHSPKTLSQMQPPSAVPVTVPPAAKFHSPKHPMQMQSSLEPPGFDINPLALSLGDIDKEKTKKRGLFNRQKKVAKSTAGTQLSIPTSIPPPPQRTGPSLFSDLSSEKVHVPVAPDVPGQTKKTDTMGKKKETVICTICDKQATTFLLALDKKYHPECFNCAACHKPINAKGPFAYMTVELGGKYPLHRTCYAELYGVKCAVCKQLIPAGPDGKVSFVKHPFFESEQMCPRHATNPGRRCTGCHRFEPEGEPFAELFDSGRCVCYSCCRTVVVDNADATPLWNNVLSFLENSLSLPIWRDMRKVPVLIVGYDALNQMMENGGNHRGSTQITTRGLCLTEHQSGRRLKLPAMKFNKSNSSFESLDSEEKGFTYFQVPDASKTNPDASVTAILCLSGLPTDLTASVLAHEATHAWIKLHPRFDIEYPIPPQVEEGCAQLVAMLFLNEGLAPASTETYGDPGPSDAKLRQYFKFSIETDDHEIYGEGYRRAAMAYANIGIEALLSHVVLYKDFPKT